MHLPAGKRQPRRPLKPKRTGLSPWSKLPRNIWCICGLGKRQPRRPFYKTRGHWLESLFQAATEHLMHLRAGKRQPRRPLKPECTGLSPWSKLPRSIWCICRPGKRQPRRPLTTEGSGLSACWQWPECLVEAAARDCLHLTAGKRPLQHRAMDANGKLQGSNSKCLWPECNGKEQQMLVARLHRQGSGKPTKTGSAPAVVPGAAPALVKAGVGGFWLLTWISACQKNMGMPCGPHTDMRDWVKYLARPICLALCNLFSSHVHGEPSKFKMD